MAIVSILMKISKKIIMAISENNNIILIWHPYIISRKKCEMCEIIICEKHVTYMKI
jgi:hypothetical protein